MDPALRSPQHGLAVLQRWPSALIRGVVYCETPSGQDRECGEGRGGERALFSAVERGLFGGY